MKTGGGKQREEAIERRAETGTESMRQRDGSEDKGIKTWRKTDKEMDRESRN